MKQVGRDPILVECRESMGLGMGGGLAQRNTISECGKKDVIAIAMGPAKRHITKPVCEITTALRQEGIQTSVIVLNAGSGVPQDCPSQSLGGLFGLENLEIERISHYKFAIIHLGSIRTHILYKARLILRNVNIPAIVVCQCPVTLSDFASVGIKIKGRTSKNAKTIGEIVDVVTGVIRGVSCPKSKLDEIITKVNENFV